MNSSKFEYLWGSLAHSQFLTTGDVFSLFSSSPFHIMQQGYNVMYHGISFIISVPALQNKYDFANKNANPNFSLENIANTLLVTHNTTQLFLTGFC